MSANTLKSRIHSKRMEGRNSIPIAFTRASAQSGIPASTLCRLENGATPNTDTFKKLCLWLDTTADELIEILPERDV